MLSRYYGVIKASYHDLSSYFCKATPASKPWVSKKETLGSVKRSCQSAWFQSGLVYTTTKMMMKAFKELKMPVRNAEGTFVTWGFHNWKLATTSFRQHEASASHKEAMERFYSSCQILVRFLQWFMLRNVMSTLEGPHLPLKLTRSHLWRL